MSLLAHATYAIASVPASSRMKLKVRKRELDEQIQFEIREAKRIQREVGCSWGEAVRLATRRPL